MKRIATLLLFAVVISIIAVNAEAKNPSPLKGLTVQLVLDDKSVTWDVDVLQVRVKLHNASKRPMQHLYLVISRAYYASGFVATIGPVLLPDLDPGQRTQRTYKIKVPRPAELFRARAYVCFVAEVRKFTPGVSEGPEPEPKKRSNSPCIPSTTK